MVFSSVFFLFYFLLTVIVIYRIVPKKLKNLVLFVSSLIFYAWGEPVYVMLMLFSIVANYLFGLTIHANASDKSIQKKVLKVSAIVNLGLLVIFKYTDFFIGCINVLPLIEIPKTNLALPIGISFYTFQAMSYVIDVYRGTAKVQKNLISFGTYIALFPQLIAGPIVRYNTIAEQLKNRSETVDKFADGFTRFTAGLAKKVLIANNIGMLWDSIRIMENSSVSVATAWLGILAYTMQIYFDFSGYSDMAIGLGKIFGFDFDENFNYPYISKSITEFWRRWHISLGTWFKEYVYIPLGGSRVPRDRMYYNIMVVWLLTGIWHGAGFNFLFWGLYYGLLLIVEKTYLLKRFDKIPGIFKHIYTMFFVMIGWVFFSAESLGGALRYIGTLLGIGGAGFTDATFSYYLSSYGITLLIALIAALPFARTAFNKFATGKKYVIVPVLVAITLIICMAYLVDATYNPFLYFRF